MEDIQKEDLSPEEIKIEEEALKETPKEEVKNQVIEKYGLTEEDDSELIDKLVEDKLADKTTLGVAIKQKRTQRGEKNVLKEKLEKYEKPGDKETPKKKDKTSQEDIDELVGKKVDETLEERAITALDYSDDLKAEIKSYATINKVSVKETLKSDYIKFKITKEEEAEKLEDASISNKFDKTKASKNFESMTAKDFDVSTKEGREGFAEFKKYLNTKK